jgi:hypothetical protein
MASNVRDLVRLYANVENQASITCPHCHYVKVANVAQYKEVRKPLKVRCLCGWVFHAVLETRQYYRKPVNLGGYYAKLGNKNFGPMTVENLSISGIGFRLRVHHAIKVGDILTVRFTLDDRLQTEIINNIAVKIVIKQVTDSFIGAEFCDITAFYKELAWYLRPS